MKKRLLFKRLLHTVVLTISISAFAEDEICRCLLRPDRIGGHFNGSIEAVEQIGETLYLGGNFTELDGKPVRGITSWNGRRFYRLGTGLSGSGCWAMESDSQHLYVAGQFSMAGDVPAKNVAMWDGSNWSAMGEGLDGTCRAMTFYGEDLIVAGSFRREGENRNSNIARWDGSQWSGLSAGLNRTCTDLAVVGDYLYAAGLFGMAGDVQARGLARWDGEKWEAVYSSIQTFLGESGTIRDLAVVGSDLFITGDFIQVDQTRVNNIARWDGQNWFSMGEGLDLSKPEINWPSMVGVGRNLYVAGTFSNPDPRSISHLRKWDGQEWSTPSFDTSPNSRVFTTDESDLLTAINETKDGEEERYGVLKRKSFFAVSKTIERHPDEDLTIAIADFAFDIIGGRPVTLVSIEASSQDESIVFDDQQLYYPAPATDRRMDWLSYVVSNGIQEKEGSLRIILSSDNRHRVRFNRVHRKASIRLDGIPGRQYMIERSDNLHANGNWHPIPGGLIKMGQEGHFDFVDEDAPTGSAFYRIVVVP